MTEIEQVLTEIFHAAVVWGERSPVAALVGAGQVFRGETFFRGETLELTDVEGVMLRFGADSGVTTTSLGAFQGSTAISGH